MRLDLRRIKARTGQVELVDWPRIIPAHHRTTPCDAGFGSSRFSSPVRSFRVLYAAQDFATALAEAVVRDRFVGKQRRYLYGPYLESLAVTEITSTPLDLVDGILFESRLTGTSCVAIFDRAYFKLRAKRSVDILRVDTLADELKRLGVTIRRQRTKAVSI